MQLQLSRAIYLCFVFPVTALLALFHIAIPAPQLAAETIHVLQGGSPQAAIDRAQAGNTTTLEPGVAYSGPFWLRRKSATTFMPGPYEITANYPEATAYPALPDMSKIREIQNGIPYDDTVCHHTATNAATFKTALTTVVPGQTICIPANTTITGYFTLPAKNNPSRQYITIRTTSTVSGSSADLPPNRRVKIPYGPNPQGNDLSKLARIINANTTGIGYAINFAPRASYYRLIGLDISSHTAGAHLVRTGNPSEQNPANLPHHILIDRCYIHGRDSTQQVRTGVKIDANYVGIVNSHIDEVHMRGNGDTQAVSIYNSLGPVLIQNNFLEAAGENIMVGGGRSGLLTAPQHFVTSDIVIQGNYIWKNPARRNIRTNVYDTKNLLELKWGQQVLIEGNVFENHWDGVQGQHYAIVFKSSDQRCTPSSPSYAETHDVTFRYNLIKNIDNALQVGRYSGCQPPTNAPAGWNPYATEGTRNIYIYGNLVQGLGFYPSTVPFGSIFYEPDGLPDTYRFSEAVGANNQIVEHNTFAKPVPSTAFYLCRSQDAFRSRPGGPFNLPNRVPNLTFRSNVAGTFSSRDDEGNLDDESNMLSFFPNLQYAGNVIVDSNGQNLFPTVNMNVSSYDAALNPDHTLVTNYNGTDGEPAGANMRLLNRCISGATTGTWSGCN